jgi:hypothetical protein
MQMTMRSGALCDQLSSRWYNIGAHYRDKVGTSDAGNNVASTAKGSNVENQSSALGSSGFSSFAALGMEDGSGQVDEEEDFGGLMVRFRIDPLVSSG